MSIHVMPTNDPRGEHLDSSDCWCRPEIELFDPETGEEYQGGALIRHNAPPGYPGRIEDEQPQGAD